MISKGIILAGGSGKRLYPMTSVFSKQLQPVYDKPMIYYPLSTLMLGGIKDILIISTPEDTPNFERILGDGSRFGIKLSYAIQEKPGGIAEAFLYGSDFIANDQVCLILGDNLFYGKLDFLRDALRDNRGGTIFGYRVQNPSDFGVVELDKNGQILSIVEKPDSPKSNIAVPGLYIFNNEVIEIAARQKPSSRGELEITDIQLDYLNRQKLDIKLMGRGIAWLDTGTPQSMLEAGIFIHAIEKRQGRKIACLEEIALLQDFISEDEYVRIVENLPDGSYKEYCLSILMDYKTD